MRLPTKEVLAMRRVRGVVAIGMAILCASICHAQSPPYVALDFANTCPVSTKCGSWLADLPYITKGRLVKIEGLNSATTIEQIGRTNDAGAFQSLVEIRSQKTLVSSGNEKGRGTIRLIDNIASPVLPMELGFYEFGAGIFVDDLFEFFASGVSIRNFDGVSQPYIEVRDAADASSIRLRNNGTIGIISATDGLAAIGILPDNTNETWRFNLSGKALQGANGATIAIDSGTAASACMGVATPNGTTPVAVSTTCAAANSQVFYTRSGAVANMGVISTTTAPSGTGFSFASTGASDTLASSVGYFIVKEG